MTVFHHDEEGIEVHPSINVDRPDLYVVTTYGRCYSVRTRRFLTLGIARQNRRPYWGWHLRRPNFGRTMVGAARVLLISFGDWNPGNGRVPDYLDGDPTNLRLDNLRWITQGEARFRDPAERAAWYADLAARGNRMRAAR